MSKRWLVMVMALLAGLAAGCGDDSGPSDDMDDASTEADGGPDGTDGPDSGMDSSTPDTDSATPPVTPPPTPDPVVCGGETCTVAAQAMMLGVMPCCTDDDECGNLSMLSTTCLPRGAPGGVDRSCPDFSAGGFLTFPGCCTPDGECGALDSSEGGSGCMANDLLMATEQSCTYDEDNMCTDIVDIACDGAEDCPSGQMCCGHFAGGYREFVCAEDCAVEEMEQGGTWSQICHPGDTCANEMYTCQPNTDFLPAWLQRCRDTTAGEAVIGSTAPDEVNCGDSVCGAGEKCCLTSPGDMAFCVAAEATCTCNPPDDMMDAGTDDDAG